MEMKKNCRYIYKVTYGRKSNKEDENYDVIKEVYYYRWEDEKNDFIQRKWERVNFAKALLNDEFFAVAGNEIEPKNFKNLIKVIAYQDKDDGELWLKTKPDDIKENNLELLDYAKKYGFAVKE